jgi:hypothetical protein
MSPAGAHGGDAVRPRWRRSEISAIGTPGAPAVTERALRALVANTEALFELNIVHNGSDAEMFGWLSEIHDALVIFNDGNRGFGPPSTRWPRRPAVPTAVAELRRIRTSRLVAALHEAL